MSMEQRKNDHIQINVQKDVQSGRKTGLDSYQFVHNSLPEMNFEEVKCDCSFLGVNLKIPLIISSMTGGTSEARKINQILATTAEKYSLAMGLGSMRIALENPDKLESFLVRKEAPSILLFANLGAVQLNYGFTSEHCKRAVETVEANGLILHLNCLQEALQPEGDTNFSGLLGKIEKVCRSLTVPVIVKEIGWGLSATVAKKLINAGVAGLDTAGAGGTSWSEVEKFRAGNNVQSQTAAIFKDWGIPLVESLTSIRKENPKIPLIASGGIKTGMDIAKCLALGADLCGIAGGYIKTASSSLEDSFQFTEIIKRQLLVTMFASGVKNINELRKIPLVHSETR
jgi:isopentenyl-diphosphate delta-isomerase